MKFYFYTRPNCPLCDRLEELIEPHLVRLRGCRQSFEWTRRNILDDPAWHEAYRHRIPVLVLDERVVLEGNPSETAIKTAFENLIE